MTLALLLLAWVVLACIVGLLVGRIIARRSGA